MNVTQEALLLKDVLRLVAFDARVQGIGAHEEVGRSGDGWNLLLIDIYEGLVLGAS